MVIPLTFTLSACLQTFANHQGAMFCRLIAAGQESDGTVNTARALPILSVHNAKCTQTTAVAFEAVTTKGIFFITPHSAPQMTNTSGRGTGNEGDGESAAMARLIERQNSKGDVSQYYLCEQWVQLVNG